MGDRDRLRDRRGSRSLLPVMVDEKPFVVVGVSAFPCGTFAAFLTGRTAVRRRRLWRGGLETRRFRLGSAIDLSPHSRLLMAPLLLCCGGIVVAAGTFISISGDPYSSLREAKLFWYGLAGVLVAAGSAWAVLAIRGQRRVRLDRRGLTVGGVLIPAAAIRGLGILSPSYDPLVTVWHDTGTADLRGARVSPGGTTMLPLTRVALLRAGRFEDLREAAGRFGGGASSSGTAIRCRNATPSPRCSRPRS